MEVTKVRTKFNKATGEAAPVHEPKEKPEGELFEAVDAGSGE